MTQSSQPTGSGPVDVAVIGGGIAGLAAAYRIVAERPRSRVVVLEGSPRFGGKLRTDIVAGTRVDVGAESLLALRSEAVDLIEEIGATEALTTPATTSARIWSRGDLHPLPRGTIMGVPTDPESVGEVLDEQERARLRNPQPWPDGVVAQDISVGAYVEATYGRAVVDRLVEPLLGGVYAGNADELSLEATTPALWAAARAGAPVHTPRTGSQASPPSTSPAARPPFAGLRGGVGTLPDLLVARLEECGVELRRDTTVRALGHDDQSWWVRVGPTTDEREIRAHAVVLAVPPPAAARLLRAVAPSAADELATIEMASSALVTFGFPRRDLPPLTGSGFLVPPVDGHQIKAATFSSNKWSWIDEASADVVFVRASFGRAGEVATLQRSDEDLIDLAHRELSAAVGADLPAPVDAHVQRWGGGLPQYAVGHCERVRKIRAAVQSCADGAGGLAVAGAAYDGVGIPAVIASADTAARLVLCHLAAIEAPHTRDHHPTKEHR